MYSLTCKIYVMIQKCYRKLREWWEQDVGGRGGKWRGFDFLLSSFLNLVSVYSDTIQTENTLF